MTTDSAPVRIAALAAEVGTALAARRLMLACAESCTGGGIGYALTQVAGSSAWFERGFITYSNEAKTELLGVPARLIAAHGAVSEPVASAMALGALTRSRAQVAVAVTGIAGPGGGSHAKPVGTVWFAWALARPGGEFTTISARHRFDGDRAAVRTQSIIVALEGVQQALARIESQDRP